MSGSLYLYPVDCRATPPTSARILDALHELALIGEPIGEDEYAVGRKFNRHVVFAGCSPQLSYEASRPGDLDFCHIALIGPYRQVHMIAGPHTRRPRCPNCAERAPTWQDLQTAWLTLGQSSSYLCARCGQDSPVLAWRWQRQAVFGRIFVAVRGVFPSEAVPSDSLLDVLSQFTARQWDYGWAATIKR